MKLTKRKYEIGLDAICALIKGNSKLAMKYAHEISDIIMPLLTSILLGSLLFYYMTYLNEYLLYIIEDKSFDVLLILCSVLPVPLNTISIVIASMLRMIVLYNHHKKYKQDDLVSHDQMKLIVDTLIKAIGIKPLSSGAYYICFLIFEIILTAPMSSLHVNVLKIISNYIKNGDNQLKKENYSLLYKVLEEIPAFM